MFLFKKIDKKKDCPDSHPGNPILTKFKINRPDHYPDIIKT